MNKAGSENIVNHIIKEERVNKEQSLKEEKKKQQKRNRKIKKHFNLIDRLLESFAGETAFDFLCTMETIVDLSRYDRFKSSAKFSKTWEEFIFNLEITGINPDLFDLYQTKDFSKVLEFELFLDFSQKPGFFQAVEFAENAEELLFFFNISEELLEKEYWQNYKKVI